MSKQIYGLVRNGVYALATTLQKFSKLMLGFLLGPALIMGCTEGKNALHQAGQSLSENGG